MSFICQDNSIISSYSQLLNEYGSVIERSGPGGKKGESTIKCTTPIKAICDKCGINFVWKGVIE